MTGAELTARTWCGIACGFAQIAATAAGMVPWWALPFTLALTVAVSQPTGPVDQTRARLGRGLGVVAVAVFATIIAVHTVTQGREGVVDPTSTLRSLTEALVVLSLIMAPAARTAREHRVWLTVTTGVLVAAAAGGTTVGQGALSVVAWIILLLATNKVQTADAYSAAAVPAALVGVAATRRRSSLIRSDATVPIISTLVAGVVVFYALPAGLGGGDLARRIARDVQQSSLTLADRAQVGVDTRGLGDLDLLVRGSLSNTPLLRVPLDSPSLWRGTFYREYSGTSWLNSEAGGFTPVAGPSATLPTISDDPLPTNGHRIVDQVQVAPDAHADLIWSPGVPTAVRGSAAEVREVIRGAENVRVFGGPGTSLTSYSVTSVVASTSPAVLEAAHGQDPANSVWTSLPAELPREVVDLARQVTAGATSRYAAVRDLERYLRAHETYSLETPQPPKGHDAVDDFLFHTHVGFCELFASAEAVMLRTLGIPARVVSGLAYGVPDGNVRLYTAASAHAWVEVYYPGVGWSPSDPTAGAQLALGAASSPSALSRAFDAVAAALPGGRIAVAVLGAVLLILVGASVRGLRLGSGRGRRRDTRPPGPVLAAFLRMTGSRDGPPPRLAAETPRQYLARVGGVRREVDIAVTALEQELYGAEPPTDEQVRAAIEAIESLASTPT